MNHLYPRPTSHYGVEIKDAYNRQLRARRRTRAMAMGGVIGLALVIMRAVAALALQDGHSLWLVLPTLICMVWGTWGFDYLLTRH